VYEQTRVVDVTGVGAPHAVVTETGVKLTADAVVLATHLPILDRSMHFAVTEPDRSYVIAVELTDPSAVPQQMYVNPEKPVRSLRAAGPDNGIFIVSESANGSAALSSSDARHDQAIPSEQYRPNSAASPYRPRRAAGGESHIMGANVDTREPYRKLEEWTRKVRACGGRTGTCKHSLRAPPFPWCTITSRYRPYLPLLRQHFPLKRVLARWSAFDYTPADSKPYIGYLHRGCNSLFTATG
jgi:glycine/D-amino acid oxidase-like deaminating enzyme